MTQCGRKGGESEPEKRREKRRKNFVMKFPTQTLNDFAPLARRPPVKKLKKSFACMHKKR